MPKRTDLRKILLIGSGPIVIGQACEFDYSGSQACKALREEGYQVVLVNSNPATIMTDPDMADSTYIEPITVETLAKILEAERPDACLPTMGGQTGLNVAIEASEAGLFESYKVELIGAKYEAIRKAEDRSRFRAAMEKIGLDLPRSRFAYSIEEALAAAREIGYPVVVRPSFTLGGTGSGVCFNEEELSRTSRVGLDYSLKREVLIEESVLGWKEFELEVMRDLKDNVVIICSIENVDPMGVHTGDSITVAPQQTLTDKEYQRMRDAAVRVIREIGVETGGSNIQFAVNPKDGRMVVIEMNPRVSRSSALASKATGFPIAKFAAKLAVGYTLDEISNDITRYTPASFEPTIDYCVVKIPRFDFSKFEGVDDTLSTQMKSVGETMAIGRTFKEALQKGLRGLETGRHGLGADGQDVVSGEKLDTLAKLRTFHKLAERDENLRASIRHVLSTPKPDRVFHLRLGLIAGLTVRDLAEASKIDPWFLEQIHQIVELERELLAVGAHGRATLHKPLLKKAKQYGFSDIQLGFLTETSDDEIRKLRKKEGVEAVFKLVDTCAAEFKAFTPYFYSTYEEEDESIRSDRKKIMILGGGPNRIGQGIEFDYCCVQAAFALKEIGFETLMVNSNPETVSTDYDTSDQLFFEPVTKEDVLNVFDRLAPEGVIVQMGGQTPLNIARDLERWGVRVIGTSVRSIDLAEDREKFSQLLRKVNLAQAENGMASGVREARGIAERIGYPVLIRPSYVLGGRAMEIVYDDQALEKYMERAAWVSGDKPVLIDRFLAEATEVDVDLLSDGETAVIGAVMEHVEEAGIHSGDSASVIPPFTLAPKIVEEIKAKTLELARELSVEGLMNVQYAVKEGVVYCLEVNPRASRTVPFVSKTIGVPLARYAAQVMAGRRLAEIGFTKEVSVPFVSIKESVLPFNKFPGVDIILSPEMRSTGEVMGIDEDFGRAFYKSQEAAYAHLPQKGSVFVSVKDSDKARIVPIAKRLASLGYTLVATRGTAKVLEDKGIGVEIVRKLAEGQPNIADKIRNRDIQLIINTPNGRGPMLDEARIRSLAVSFNIPCITTVSAARAACEALESFRAKGLSVCSIQAYHSRLHGKPTRTGPLRPQPARPARRDV